MRETDKREDGLTEQRPEYAILVVEDEADVRRTIAEMLKRMKYRVLEASDGDEALEICARTEHIDLLLSDLIMPGMTGRMLADKVKALQPGIRVLLMSGHIDDARTVRLDPGLQYLQKPVTVKKLADKIAGLLATASK